MDREEFDNYLVRLMSIESRIKASDMAGILCRWESGKVLLEMSNKHEGTREELARQVGINKQEVEARIKMAIRFKSQAKLEAIAKEYGTWTYIVRAYLLGKSIEEAKAMMDNNRARSKERMAQIGRGGRGRATLSIEIPEELTRDLLAAGYPAKTAMKDFVNSITAGDVIGRIQKEEAS